MSKEVNIRARPRAEFLTSDQIERIHESALSILERTGVVVHHDGAVKMLAGAGCEVSRENTARDATGGVGEAGKRVRIPSRIVEDAIRSAPESITIYDRNGGPALFLEGDRSYWGTGSDTPFVLDSLTGRRRQTCLDDVLKASRLVDSLENFDFLMCMGVAHELPQGIADKHHFLTMVSNTSKPLVFTAGSTENLADIHQMACEVSGSGDVLLRRPFIVHYTEPIAPLIHPKDSVEKLLYCVEHGIPVIYTSATTAGQNGPVTLAGALTLSVARILSGLVIGQLARKGAGMAVTMHASSMDLRNASHTYASPEHVICQAAARSMAAYYKLPTFGRAGTTDSKVPDEQAAFEAGYEILMHGLCGENLVHDVGYIESGLTASWDMMVMCDEFIGAVKRVCSGFELGDDELALDLIDTVGPEGHFMAEPHTVENMRKEFWIPSLFDRQNYQDWQDAGRHTLLDRVRETVRDILSNHRPEGLSPELTRRLEELANIDHTQPAVRGK